jgi:hypothetical protein
MRETVRKVLKEVGDMKEDGNTAYKGKAQSLQFTGHATSS